ncbi:unnamed protein product, partial [Tilletia caries]
ELLTDVAAELRDRPYDFQLTDIRGSGYYGPYHSLIVAEAIKKRLRQRVTECSELSLARAAEQMLPLLFARLIEKDGNIARRAAADVLRDSRVYGLLVFPASILTPTPYATQIRHPPSLGSEEAKHHRPLFRCLTERLSPSSPGPLEQHQRELLSLRLCFMRHRFMRLRFVLPPSSPGLMEQHHPELLSLLICFVLPPSSPGSMEQHQPELLSLSLRVVLPPSSPGPLELEPHHRLPFLRMQLHPPLSPAGPRQPLAPQAAAPAQPQGWKPPVEWRSTGRYPVKEGTQPIEQGGFGTVYHCIDRLLPNFEVAKKRQQWDEGDPVPNRYILREVAALRRCNGHNNVIHLKDVIYNADPAGPYVDFILPLTTASLDKVIRVNRAGVDVITAKTFLQQVVAGLSWIHKRGWIHCDLKPENVLVFKDYTCRITDFGLAKVKNPAQRLARPCGTIGYRPPEELFNNHFADESMDIWPLGTIYAELRKGGRLFDASSNLACFKSMIEVTGIDRRTVYEFPEADASIDGARSFALCKADPTRLWLLTRTNCRSSCPSSSWSPNDVHPRKASVSIRPGRSTLRQIEPF